MVPRPFRVFWIFLIEITPRNMSTLPPQLQELAQCFGVLTSYQDVHKQRRDVSAETVLAVLQALGVDLPSIDKASEVLMAEQTKSSSAASNR